MFLAASMAVWGIAMVVVAGILLRPLRVPEWVWAAGGAATLVALRLVPLGDAIRAVERGADVYGFLIGIMVLAELARYERVFDWLSSWLLRAARGSRARLLGLIYLTGMVATALLSNDTTAVVLTPAVYGALAKTDADPLPYLYACAFVANAASFVLPISNPANLVVFGRGLPPLWPWLQSYGLPSVAAVLLTYAALRLMTAQSIQGKFVGGGSEFVLGARGRVAAAVVGASALLLVVAALLGWNLGVTAFAAAAVSLVLSLVRDVSAPRAVLRHVAWGVVPLVAGLFVVVQALDASGAIDAIRHLLAAAEQMTPARGNLLIAATITVADNIFNNLPVALASGYAIQSMHPASHVADAALIAVDLGPNLSVTGSLATLLWLIALRRDRVEVSVWQFLRLGFFVVTPALTAAVLLVR